MRKVLAVARPVLASLLLLVLMTELKSASADADWKPNGNSVQHTFVGPGKAGFSMTISQGADVTIVSSQLDHSSPTGAAARFRTEKLSLSRS